MLDPYVRPYIDVPLNRMGQWMAYRGLSANMVTFVGFIFGLIACGLIVCEYYTIALFFLCLNRLLDGLDGAIARQNTLSDFGGFFDIVCDFIAYSGIVYAFGIANSDRLLAVTFLLFSFIGPMSSFLAYAIFAAKNNQVTTRRGKKSFYHLGGLCEGTETSFFMIFICLFPDLFNPAAYIFGTLCWFTTLGRVYMAWDHFK